MNQQQKKTLENSEEIHNNIDQLNNINKPIEQSIKEVEEYLNNKTDNFTWEEWLGLFVTAGLITHLMGKVKQIKNIKYKARTMHRLRYALAGGGISNEQYIKEITKANFYKFADRTEKDMKESLEDSLKTAYYKEVYNTQMEIGMYFQVSKVDYSVLNQSWGRGNWKYSKSVWKDTEEVANRLNTLLIENIKKGNRVKDLRKEFADLTDLGNYAIDRLLRTETTRAINEGLIQAFKEEGVKQVQYIAVLDSGTCETCQKLDLKVFDIDNIEAQPPVHPNCYKEGTEVYTNEGWKDFRDLTGKELFYSVDIEKDKLIPEFIKCNNLIKYYTEEQLVHFYNKTYDLYVTQKHNMVTKYNKKDGANKYRFVTAENLPRYNNVIPRYIDWEGIEKETIKLGNYHVPVELYCKFMAYYLADGSVSQTRKHEIKISQKTHIDKMYDELKKLPIKVTKCSYGLYLRDESIYKYLMQFGKCNDKYIPNEIKDLTPNMINIFLKAYAITDGTIKKAKKWGKYTCNEFNTYFTTSKRMADDLGELILKAGYKPAFKLVNSKNKSCFNGKYKHNYDLWNIYQTKSKVSCTETINRELVDYKGNVYCVELEKYHTLLVRYNGKITWSGNCRCVLVAYKKYIEGMTRRARDKEGKYILIPANITYKDWYNTYIKPK